MVDVVVYSGDELCHAPKKWNALKFVVVILSQETSSTSSDRQAQLG